MEHPPTISPWSLTAPGMGAKEGEWRKNKRNQPDEAVTVTNDSHWMCQLVQQRQRQPVWLNWTLVWLQSKGRERTEGLGAVLFRIGRHHLVVFAFGLFLPFQVCLFTVECLHMYVFEYYFWCVWLYSNIRHSSVHMEIIFMVCLGVQLYWIGAKLGFWMAFSSESFSFGVSHQNNLPKAIQIIVKTAPVPYRRRLLKTSLVTDKLLISTCCPWFLWQSQLNIWFSLTRCSQGLIVCL